MQLVGLPGFWLGLVVGVAACLLPDLAFMAFRRAVSPSDFHIVQVSRPVCYTNSPCAQVSYNPLHGHVALSITV